MFVPFQRTLRASQADGVGRPFVYALIALGLLGVWWAWFACAKVPLFVTSEKGRIEVNGIGNTVDSPVAGTLVSTQIALGKRVTQGDVLAQLERSIIEQRLAEARARHEALGPEIAARQREIEAESALQTRRDAHMRQSIATALAEVTDAQAQSNLAAEEARREAKLYAQRAISEMENMRVSSSASQTAARTRAARLIVLRLRREREAEAGESVVQIARLRSEIVDLQGTEASTAAAEQALAYELEHTTIRAPVSGQIAEIAGKQVGAFVQAGDRLATIIPDDGLRAVAEFSPAAVGRIRPGQSARVRLDGFPWMQYGSIVGTVAQVGAEMRDGMVRAELALHLDPSSLIPLQHGMSGEVEVEIERVTPLRFVLRLGGGRGAKAHDAIAGGS